MESLVLDYLRRKGYSEAASKLNEEIVSKHSKANEGKASVAPISLIPRGDSAITNALLSANTLTSEAMTILKYRDSDEEKDIGFLYIESFKQFYQWAVNSLDIVKKELLALCFPIFVLIYISLIRQDLEEEAKRFWKECYYDFFDMQARELNSLSMLTTRAQLDIKNTMGEDFLKTNLFVKCVLHSKFQVKLSNLAYQLIFNYLSSNQLMLFAAIINDRIDLVKVNTTHNMNSTIDLKGYYIDTSTLQYRIMKDISLGVPGKGSIKGNKYGEVPDFHTHELFGSLLANIVLKNTLVKAATQTQTISRDFFSTENVMKTSRTSEKNRKSTCTADLEEPSVLFGTFTNTHEGLISMDMNDDTSLCAAGFQDSCVRIWNLNPSRNELDFSQAQSIGKQPWAYTTYVEPVPGDNSSHGTPGAGRITLENVPLYRNQYERFVRTATDGNNETDKQPLRSKYTVQELRGHCGPIYSIDIDKSDSNISPGSVVTPRLVVSGSSDDSLRLWDLKLNQCVGKYGTQTAAWAVSFAPLGYFFASGHMDRTVRLFNTERSKPIRMMTNHTSDVTCLAWHPNSTLLASGSEDKTVRVYDIATGGSVRIFSGALSPITSLHISPVGDKICAGTDRGVIHVWDIATEKPLCILTGHTHAVYSVSFSSDGTMMTSGSEDCSVKVWNLDGIIAEPAPIIGVKRKEEKEDVLPILQSAHSFQTKSCPVYYAKYNRSDMIVASGPFVSSYISQHEQTIQKTEMQVVKELGVQTAKPLE